MTLTLPQGKKETYQLARPICNLWGQCCCNKILLFWWNSHCKIKVNLNQSLYFLFLHIISLFPFPLVEFVNNGRGFYFSWPWKTQDFKKCYVCASMMVSFLGFKKSKDEKKNDPKEWKHILTGWSLSSYLNGFTPELVDTKEIICY